MPSQIHPNHIFNYEKNLTAGVAHLTVKAAFLKDINIHLCHYTYHEQYDVCCIVNLSNSSFSVEYLHHAN